MTAPPGVSRGISIGSVICSLLGTALLAALLVFRPGNDQAVRMVLLLTGGCFFCFIGAVLGLVGVFLPRRYKPLSFVGLLIGMASPMVVVVWSGTGW